MDIRILRAFAWMRWRVFINSLEKSSARDAIERFSLAIEHLAPILVLVVMIPSALALLGLSGYAGFQLATGGDRTSIPFQLLRYLLLGATIFTIVGQILMPAADRTNAVRLLLLPIPARTLYVAQSAGALSDPWILLLIPIVLGIPGGLAAGGALGAAAIALVAGLCLLLALLGLSSLVTTIIHLVVRDRRRGELVALLLILVLPVLALIPAALGDSDRRSRARKRDIAAQEERRTDRGGGLPSWLSSAAGRAFGALPSELYTRGIAVARETGPARAALPVAGLAATAIVLNGFGLMLFGRILSSSAKTGSRRTAAARDLWARVLPGLSPGASAVALALLRLALRTPRGRSILIAPLLMLGVFGVLVARAGTFDFGPFHQGGGLSLGVFLAAVSMISILPLSMNQFAVDGAGLTTTLLAPLTSRQILAGKAVGAALVILPPTLLCVAVSGLVFGGGHPAMWMSLPLAVAGTYILVSPAAAVFSAMLPRAVDMNSIGRGSNAHGLSGLLGILAYGAATLPCVALTLIATKLLSQPWLAPLLLLLWCGVAFAIASLLFRLAARTFDARRENLAMLM